MRRKLSAQENVGPCRSETEPTRNPPRGEVDMTRGTYFGICVPARGTRRKSVSVTVWTSRPKDRIGVPTI